MGDPTRGTEGGAGSDRSRPKPPADQDGSEGRAVTACTSIRHDGSTSRLTCASVDAGRARHVDELVPYGSEITTIRPVSETAWLYPSAGGDPAGRGWYSGRR